MQLNGDKHPGKIEKLLVRYIAKEMAPTSRLQCRRHHHLPIHRVCVGSRVVTIKSRHTRGSLQRDGYGFDRLVLLPGPLGECTSIFVRLVSPLQCRPRLRRHDLASIGLAQQMGVGFKLTLSLPDVSLG